jgi:hypothetical protein
MFLAAQVWHRYLPEIADRAPCTRIVMVCARRENAGTVGRVPTPPARGLPTRPPFTVAAIGCFT